jgi:hypothetical protein
MASAKATYSTTGAYQPEDPVLRWLEKGLPLGSLKHAELTAHAIFKAVFSPHGDLTAEDDKRAFYIGLGDQFDDDRRVVSETPSVLGSLTSPTELVVSPGKNSTTEDEQ